LIENATQQYRDRMQNDADIFHVADHVDPSTMGIWLVVTDIVLNDGSTLVFMDSEGFFGKQRRAAALAALLRRTTYLTNVSFFFIFPYML
jgi:hypothetical protein